MSTPTPTQAHYDLRREIIHSAPDDGAQLIADSEAKAVAKQVEAVAILTLRWDKVENELVALRARAECAEVELNRLLRFCAERPGGAVMSQRMEGAADARRAIRKEIRERIRELERAPAGPALWAVKCPVGTLNHTTLAARQRGAK